MAFNREILCSFRDLKSTAKTFQSQLNLGGERTFKMGNLMSVNSTLENALEPLDEKDRGYFMEVCIIFTHVFFKVSAMSSLQGYEDEFKDRFLEIFQEVHLEESPGPVDAEEEEKEKEKKKRRKVLKGMGKEIASMDMERDASAIRHISLTNH